MGQHHDDEAGPQTYIDNDGSTWIEGWNGATESCEVCEQTIAPR